MSLSQCLLLPLSTLFCVVETALKHQINQLKPKAKWAELCVMEEGAAAAGEGRRIKNEVTLRRLNISLCVYACIYVHTYTYIYVNVCRCPLHSFRDSKT